MDFKLPPQYQRSFKDADIRGIMVSELDDDLAYYIARAFVDEGKHKKLVVGYDMRLSTPSLAEAFMRGAQDAGADVVNIGLANSPMLYFASGSLDLPGVMITASHSPANYNGLKLVRAGAVPLTKASGLTAILHRIETGKYRTPKVRGRRQVKNIRNGYQSYVLKGFNKKSVAGMKIAVDIGNGMASLVVPLLEEKLPISFTSLFADMDGRFPNRGSDPTIRKHQKALVKLLKTKGFDFGIAFDGDADRIAFLDEKGAYVNCAVIGALVAQRMLQRQPGKAVVFTSLTSRVYEETIKTAGGKAVRARVGHAFVKQKMADTDAIFGCEHSGHFFFKEFFNTDSVVFTLRYVLEVYAEAKAAGQTFSQMVAPYLRYQQLEDVVIDVVDKQQAMRQVESYVRTTWPSAQVQKFDGWRITTDAAWGVVKASVTEHALKVMFEAKKKTDADTIQDKLVKYIKSIA